eukprot:scaffold110880_cov34-Cyclotella_meneghiniana.AAC.3
MHLRTILHVINAALTCLRRGFRLNRQAMKMTLTSVGMLDENASYVKDVDDDSKCSFEFSVTVGYLNDCDIKC